MTELNREYETKQMNDIAVNQRIIDGYINATALCRSANKKINDYLRLESTKEFLNELSADTGFPVTELIQVVRGGFPKLQGTWVHPYVALNLAQWLSPKFAVQVSKWIYEWMTQGFNIEVEHQKHELFKEEMKSKGSESGRFLANLRWHVNPAIKEKDRYFEENRQLSLFPETKKIIH